MSEIASPETPKGRCSFILNSAPVQKVLVQEVLRILSQVPPFNNRNYHYCQVHVISTYGALKQEPTKAMVRSRDSPSLFWGPDVFRSEAWDKHFVVVRYAREEKQLGLTVTIDDINAQ